MQIPNDPFPFGPGFLRQPQPGTRQQVTPELQVKANAPGVAAKAVKGAASGAGASAGLATARSLDEAVQTLSAEGRLPPRGSLVDIRA